MLLSTSTGRLTKHIGPEKTIRTLAAAGYDAADCTLCDLVHPESPLHTDYAETFLREMKNTAEECGIVFNQSHAPFNFGEEDDEDRMQNWILPTIRRSMWMASRLGVPNIIVHPIRNAWYKTNREALWEKNLKFFRTLQPACEEYGIRIAIENLYQFDPVRKCYHPANSNTPEEFNGFLDELNSPWFVGCLDIGHAALAGYEPQDMIRAIGNRNLKCLHVHDVDYLSDTHTLPYMSKLNWEEITLALGEIDYQGDWTFEADNFFRCYDEEYLAFAVKFMHDTGRHLIRKVEAARKK